MSNEIKLDYTKAETALSELKSTASQFDSSLSSQKEGQNNLDMVNQLNELKESFDELATSYQQLLLKSTEAALQAAETMKETDQTLGATMEVK